MRGGVAILGHALPIESEVRVRRVGADALEAALHRGAIAGLAVAHLWWSPGSRPLVYESSLAAWLPWLGLIPALLLVVGRVRGLCASVLALFLAVAAVAIAREGSDPVALLPSLAVLASLAYVGVAVQRDPFSLDRWHALAAVPLPDLHRDLRRPLRPPDVGPIAGATLPLVRVAIAGLLAVTAWLGWSGPEIAADRTAAGARAVVALWLVLPLGHLYARSVRRTTILALYDERCHFCGRTLLWLRALDPGGCWRFHSDSDLPAELRARPELDRRNAMFTVEGQRTERGYHAFRHLLTAYRALAPGVTVMGWWPVVRVGEWIYGKVAAHRAEWFACAVEDAPE